MTRGVSLGLILFACATMFLAMAKRPPVSFAALPDVGPIGVGVPPPPCAIVLFDGSKGPGAARAELNAKWVDWRDWPKGHEGEGWKSSVRNVSPAGFEISPDPEFPRDTNHVTLRATGKTAPPYDKGGRWGYDDIEVRPEFHHGDARIHVEWIAMGRHDPRDPENPDMASVYSSDRGAPHYSNSGVYVQNRYEVQILSSPLGNAITDPHAMGSIVNEYAPTSNPGRANGKWQSYDIVFQAARWNSGKMITPARMSVWWNGVLVHDNRAVTGKATGLRNTSGEPVDSSLQGLKLQVETGDVRYRNIWMLRLDSDAAPMVICP
jgi:hypothetical protein